MPLALTHSPVDPDEQMLTKHCISRPVSRSDQDRNTKTTDQKGIAEIPAASRQMGKIRRKDCL